MKRRLLAILMAAAMLFVMLPISVSAASTVVEVSTAEGLYAALSAPIDTPCTVSITKDIDMSGYKWHSINKSSVSNKQDNAALVIEGNNHQITNLTAPLFEMFDGVSITIQNLTVADARNTSIGGVFFIFNEAQEIVLNNCHLTNSSLESYSVSLGVGGFIGTITSIFETRQQNVMIKNCSVTNCTMKGNQEVGGMIGRVSNPYSIVTVDNCTIADNSLIHYEDANTWNPNTYSVGAVVGQMGPGTLNLSNITLDGNTMEQYNGSTEVTRPEDRNNIEGLLVGYQPASNQNSIVNIDPSTITGAVIEEEERGPINFFMFLLLKQYLTEYEITVETVGDGSVTTDNEALSVRFSKDITFTAVPGEGSELLSSLLDGVEVAPSAENEFTLEKVKAAHTITFIFSEVE